MQPTGGALAGLRVLELANETGMLAGKLMADMGAEVIKIERPGGDPTRSVGPFLNDSPHPERSLFFWHYNTSKKGITLSLEMAQGAELFRRLIETTDVVIETHRPGNLESLGLGYEALKLGRPNLIMCSITPFGQTGPYAHLKTSDLVSMALGGPVASTGYDELDVAPVRPGGGQSYHTACHYAIMSIMLALVHRQMAGTGQYINVSMHDSLSCTTESATIAYYYERKVVRRKTGGQATRDPTPREQFRCKDGRYINPRIMADVDAWNRLVEWMDSEGMAEDLTDPSYQRQDASPRQNWHVKEVLEKFCAAHDADTLFHEAQRRGMAWTPVAAPHETLEYPHLRDRDYFTDVHHPEVGRSFTYPGAPYKFYKTPWRIRSRAPLIGEHNDEVYGGTLGIPPDELANLHTAGVI